LFIVTCVRCRCGRQCASFILNRSLGI
jgi:hypothetical protein